LAVINVPRRRVAEVAATLDSPEIVRLIEDLENTRWTGRPGYPIRALLGVALAKSIYGISTWSRTVALVHEHEALQRALGAVPSVYAAYRFAGKLRAHKDLLDSCISHVLERLRSERPAMGENIAIDASDLPAYSSVQPYTSLNGDVREPGQYSDMDASWGYRTAVATRKSKWFYGHKIHMATCSLTGLPLAWEVKTASTKEMSTAVPLLDQTIRRRFPVQTVAMDKGYDVKDVYEGCLIRGTLPVIPKRNLKGTHGVRLSRFLPRDTPRWKALYRARTAVEREFSQLKAEWAMLPLKIRGHARVQLHVDLTILAKLCCAAEFR
jgi:hypothetical protein